MEKINTLKSKYQYHLKTSNLVKNRNQINIGFTLMMRDYKKQMISIEIRTYHT
jgi:hypothetical protein